MPDSAISEAVSIALSNAAQLASGVTLASMLVAYIICNISVRKMGTDFSLKRLESFELERAVLLYEKVFHRVQEIRREGEQAQAGLLARYKHRKKVRRKFAEELADLDAYAAHLRSSVIRLRCRPIQRFKSWLHINSSCSALSRSLALCFLVPAVLAALSYFFGQHGLFEQQALAEELDAAFAGFLAWQPVHDRMLYAATIGVVFLPVVTPIFYFNRRAKLRLQHGQQLRSLKEFALTNPDRLIERAPIDTVMSDTTIEVPAETTEERTCFSVLGLSPSATIDDVKQAYKAQVKQNHPDRVHDMSPSFRALAEAQMKKLNAAYAEALMSLQHV
jgi:DnaJ domain